MSAILIVLDPLRAVVGGSLRKSPRETLTAQCFTDCLIRPLLALWKSTSVLRLLRGHFGNGPKWPLIWSFKLGRRSWRRPPHPPLCQAQAPQHTRTGALKDAAVLRSGHKGPPRGPLPCRVSAPHDHACTRPDSTSCLPSSSVANVRNMLKSCDNRARREKRNGKRFHRHAEWPQVADAMIDARPPLAKTPTP